jgi:hypothetical protein
MEARMAEFTAAAFLLVAFAALGCVIKALSSN